MRPLKQLIAANQGNHLSGVITNAMNFLKLHHVSWINQRNKLDQEGGGINSGVSVLQESCRHGGDLIRLMNQTNVASITHYQSGGTARHTYIPDLVCRS